MKIQKLEDMKVWKESVSIPSNIAEGFERQSDAEFSRFLYIAKGSCAELKIQLLISFKIGYLEDLEYKNLKEKCDYISVMIYKLIVYLKKK